MANHEYKAGDIRVLEGLDAVRKRPGMYIGTTGAKGMHHILWEIIDNSVDEVANGFGDTVTIELLEDNVARVSDNGRGIPVDKHPKLKISGVEVVFTQLHAGAKFDSGQYAYSGGLHGVGASVTNALSEWLTVDVKRDGHLYRAEFWSPQVGGKIKSGVVKTPLTLIGKTKEKGSTITFKPDERVFGTEKFSYSVIAQRMREVAYLNKGITIKLLDSRLPLAGGTEKTIPSAIRAALPITSSTSTRAGRFFTTNRFTSRRKKSISKSRSQFSTPTDMPKTSIPTSTAFRQPKAVRTRRVSSRRLRECSTILRERTTFSKKNRQTCSARIFAKVWLQL